ncbi:MAG: type II secretion system minor pseudopilin GspI [Alphaproteobacteria bacterium]|nr:type II secretion system minor pseudopilin GspI [Alphaproteobacteria bacterium]
MMSTRTQQGFTLVEVLVALGVFSIAAMALAHLGNESLMGARQVSQRFLASVEADNVMAETLVRPDAVAPGIETGRTVQRGREFDWNRTIVSTGRDSLFAVTVLVSDVQTGQQLVSRQTLIRKPVKGQAEEPEE